MAISPQQLTIYLYSAHRAVVFAIAQLSCIWCRRVGLLAICPESKRTRYSECGEFDRVWLVLGQGGLRGQVSFATLTIYVAVISMSRTVDGWVWLSLANGLSLWLVRGSLTLRAERQSAQMSKITNDGLIRSGTECSTYMATADVKGLKRTCCPVYNFLKHPVH